MRRRRTANPPRTVPLAKVRRLVREDDEIESRRRLPLLRSDCIDLPRPCGFVSCRYHLYLDAARGGIKVNHPAADLADGPALDLLPETCALDVAAKGGLSLEELAGILNITREAVRLIEGKALRKLARLQDAIALRDEYFERRELEAAE